MRTPLAFVALAFCLGSCANLTPEKRDLRGALQLGMRQLDEDLWAPTEDQFSLGGEFVMMSKENGLGFESLVSFSADGDEIGNVDVTATTIEASAGVRAELTGQAVRPYVGVGVALINAEIEAESGGSTNSEDDTSFAGYAHAGIEVPFAERFYLGFDVRSLFGSDMEFSGVSGDADYLQFAVVFGASF